MSAKKVSGAWRFTLRAGLVGLTTLPLLASCHSHLGAGGAALTPPRYDLEREIEDIVYTPPGWPAALHADLLLPRKPGPHPVVITIHGGSWANRDRDDMASLAARLARRGYAAFNISYRFAPQHVFPAQLDDVREALRWLERNADRYALDRSRINTWGFSAGAHLAALVAAYDGDEPSPPIRAVVAGGIPSDLRKYDRSPIVERFLGGSRDALPAVYADASPVTHVSPGDPPVFLYHGRLDRLVSADQATDYHASLRARGIDSELFLHRWRGHASLLLFGSEAERRAIDFLDRKNDTRARSDA